MPEAYVPRIGRTARPGAAGLAISFCNDEERAYLRDIEKLTRLKVPVAPVPAGFASLAPSLAPAEKGPSLNGHRHGPGRSQRQPAKAEARRSADDASATKKRRRRRRPQSGGGVSAQAPALPGFILNSEQDRRAQASRGARH